MHLEDYAEEVAGWNAEAGHLKDATVFDRDTHYRELALKLIEEEVAELREATQGEGGPDYYEILDAVADILFTLFGFTSKAGINHYLEPVLVEVMASNDSKLKGTPVVLPGGKIGKPDTYVAPDIKGVVRKVNRELGGY